MTQIIVFTKYHDIKKIDNHSFRSKYSFLASFSYDLDEFSKFKPQKEKTREKIKYVFSKYKDLVETQFDECNDISDAS